MKVKALQNFGLEGKNVEPGAIIDWDDAKHGKTLGEHVKQGLVEIVKDDAPATAEKPAKKTKK